MVSSRAAFLACLSSLVACAVAPQEGEAPRLGRASSALTDVAKVACAFRFTAARAPSVAAAGTLVGKGFAGSSASVLAGDVDGDGKGDLVALVSGDQVMTYLGNGDGTFGAGIAAQVPTAAGQTLVGLQGVSVGDFDGDGRKDIVLLSTTSAPNSPNSWTGRFVVMYGAPGGALAGVLQTGTFISAGNGTVWHLAADLDGDGKDDFVYANFGVERVMFGAAGRMLASPVAAWPNANGSSRQNLFTTKLGGTSALVIVTAGPTAQISFGANRVATVLSKTSPSLPGGTLGADLDADGTLDLVGTSAPLTATSLGSAQAPSKFPAAGGAKSVIDLDADGKAEIVYGDANGALAAACGYEPGGTELAARMIGVTLGATGRIVSWVDLNGDGKPDLVGRSAAGALVVFVSGAKPTPAEAGPVTVLGPTAPQGSSSSGGTSSSSSTSSSGGSSSSGGTSTSSSSSGGTSSSSSSGATSSSSGATEEPAAEEEPGEGPQTVTKTTSGCAMGGPAPSGGASGFGLAGLAAAAAVLVRRRRR